MHSQANWSADQFNWSPSQANQSGNFVNWIALLTNNKIYY